MRILLITQHWYPENGVPQRRWSWLTEILIQAGHDVVVLAPPPARQRRDQSRRKNLFKLGGGSIAPERGPSGEVVYRTRPIPVGDSLSAKAFGQMAVALSQCAQGARLRRRINADLIIGTVPALPTAVVTFFLAKTNRLPYMVDLRDAWPDLMGQADRWNESVGPMSRREKLARRGPLQLLATLATEFLHMVLRNADAIMVTSSSLKEALIRRPALARKGKRPRVEVIRNVFPVQSQPSSDRSVLERGADELNVLYAGTIGRAQNLQNAIEAANIAAQKGLAVHLAFVGAGAARDTVAAYAEELKVQASFNRHQPAENLNDYYEWADTALVHLTEWEPLERTVPSKTYELMSNQIHISGVVVGEAAELIRELQSGDVVGPERSEDLAELWLQLARDRSRLIVSDTGARWVREQRETVAPQLLLDLVTETGRTQGRDAVHP